MPRLLLPAAITCAILACATRAENFDLQREIQKANKDTLPYFAKGIEENTDAKVALEVDAVSFGSDEKAWSNLHIIANRIMGAFLDVGRDQVGKDAIDRDVKKVVIVKLPETGEDVIELQARTLYVRTSASDKAMVVLQNRIVAALEKALQTGHPPTP